MISYRPQVINLFKQLLLVFVMYTLCRLLFYGFNKSYFNELSFSELGSILFYGLRFDAFSISAFNSLYILLCLLPFKFYYQPTYQKTTSLIFIITNTFGLLLNFIDFAYFPFTQKRTTFEVVHLIFGGESEFMKLLPHFLMGYWYLVLLFFGFIYAFSKLHYHIRKSEELISIPFTIQKFIGQLFTFVSLAGITVIGLRGGLQRIPIVLLDAANYTKPNYIPILINTSFSILKSADLTELQPLNLVNENELKKIYSPIHQADTAKFQKINVCVVILESFSKEYTGLSNRKSYTPFLDSLMNHSLVYTNAMANGKTSINGIPAIVASVPCFLENNYLNSMYSNNTIQTLPSLLKSKGYYSVFYHGGTNGTMNFNSFAQLAGYDQYFGRTEYNNDADYDGQWGIWDEPFLQKTVQEMGNLKQPFFTSIFTLSSHNPFVVPDKYKNKFPKGTLEIHQCIGYADYALKQFFISAQKQSWFNNTLFVITADHTSISDDAFYANNYGQYNIPIILYQNGIKPIKDNRTTQQIDILPTVLDYLNYDQAYYSFGNSMFNQEQQPTLYYHSPNFFCAKDSMVYVINQHKFIEAYNIKQDSLMKNNLLNSIDYSKLQAWYNAYIQTYTNDVINNKTHFTQPKQN